MEIAVNWWAIIVSMIASVAIGFTWYGPLFGKVWMKETGIKMPESGKKPNMTKPVILSLLGALLLAYVLNYGIAMGNTYFNTSGVSAGLMAAFWYWLGFIVPAYLNFVAWEGKSWTLFMINSGYWLVYMLVAGAIIAAWI